MSGNEATPTTDRRVLRTRRALLEAFNGLVLSRRYEEISVADIIERAQVGRSTFYEHYAGRDAIHLDAIAHPLAHLADAVTGRGNAGSLTQLLEHFWENRAVARSTFGGPQYRAICRILAGQISDRLDADARAGLTVALASVQLSEGQLGLIRAWVFSEITAKPPELAEIILTSSVAALSALRTDPD